MPVQVSAFLTRRRRIVLPMDDINFLTVYHKFSRTATLLRK